MRRVAASEHDLLVVARAMTGLVSAEAARPLLRQARSLAPRLGPTALGLLRDTLAKGAVLALCRRGGWVPTELLDEQGSPRGGRLWERLPAPALCFTLSSLELCRWLTREPLTDPEAVPLELGREPSPADELLLYLACDLLERCDCSQAAARSPAFRRSPLCWLGFADVLARGGLPGEPEACGVRLEPLFEEPRRFLLEGLQRDLARRWLAMERGKARLGASRLLDLGQAQLHVLDGLATAAEDAGRRDLLGFVWQSGARLLRHRPAAGQWLGGLSPESSLEERSRACREGGAAFLRTLLRLRGWVEEARGQRFFDDDYPAAQLMLRQWEELGAAGSQHAQQLVDALEALDAPLGVPAASEGREV